MNIASNNKNLILLLLLFVLVFACMIITTDEAFAATKGIVYGTDTDGLNVRSTAGGDWIDNIPDGTEVTVLDNVILSNGDKWYHISYYDSSDKKTKTGYVSASYVRISQDYVYDEEFENALDEQGFPESYKYYLRQIHALYPNWIFKAHNTGLDWNYVVKEESKIPRNLVHSSADDSWKSYESGAIDPDTGEHIVFDSGGWVAASSSIIQYYLDPRNFLDENGVFQFVSHSYDAQGQTKEGLQKVVAETFLDNKFPETGYNTYSDVIMYAGKNAKANPYVLASMIIVEQGADGKGNSISGKVSGYTGYYNFFNIGAYAHSGKDAVENGLIYAKEEGWNSRTASIIQGAVQYAAGYINNNQNTQYLKKFNVMNGKDNVAMHQYMTNVSGAAQEATELRKGYSDDDAITFFIPVYKNMPDVACPKPSGGNNNYFLKTLGVAGYDLLPAFNMYTDSYELVVSSDVTYVNINAVASDSGAKVTGTGRVQLTGDVTEAKITVKSTSGLTKTYTITIAKQDDTSTNIASSKYKIRSGKITGVGYSTSFDTFKSNIVVPDGHTIKIFDKAGKEVTGGVIGTGTKVVLYLNNEEVKTYNVVIKGDPSGDGKISSVDVLYAQRHIVKTYTLEGAYFDGADINSDGKISSVDVLYMQRHIVGTYTIKN